MTESTVASQQAQQNPGGGAFHQGHIEFKGALPVNGEIPIDTELPLEGDFPTRVNLFVEGMLAMKGSIPLNMSLPINTTVPCHGGVLCRGEADFTGSLPVHGSIPISGEIPFQALIPPQQQQLQQPAPIAREAPPAPMPPPKLPEETVTVQRIVRPAPPRQPTNQPRQKPRSASAPIAPCRQDVPPPRPPQPVLLPAYVDPRPVVPHERGERAHDFEYHREGQYAARKNSLTRETVYRPAGPARYGGAPIAPGPIVSTSAPIVGSDYDRAFTHQPIAPRGVDPRPPLWVEKEKVYDYEVHREGAYAKGHTVAGARPAQNLRSVLAGPSGGSYSNAQPLA